MVESTAVHAAGAALAAVVTLYALSQWFASRDRGARVLLLGGVAAPLAVAAGHAAAAAGVGTLAAGVPAARHAGWLVGTLAVVALLCAVAGVPRGILTVTVVLDALWVGFGLAGAALDAPLAGFAAGPASLGLWGASAGVLVGLLFVVLGPVSGSASSLTSDEAAAFSVLRNVFVGGALLATAVTGAGAGVLGAIGPVGTAAGFVAVDLLVVGGASLLVVTQRGVLADAV